MTEKKETEKKEDEKHPLDLTTDEAIETLFPKQVVDHLKQVAHGKEKDEKSDSTQEGV